MHLTIFTDGGSRGNPGPAAIGGVVRDQAGTTVAEVSSCIGTTTNNQAEYQAVIATLQAAKNVGATSVDCYMDSLLVVNQMNGDWKVKDPQIAKRVMEVRAVASTIGRVTFTHVRREKNTVADALVNRALDKA